MAKKKWEDTFSKGEDLVHVIVYGCDPIVDRDLTLSGASVNSSDKVIGEPQVVEHPIDTIVSGSNGARWRDAACWLRTAAKDGTRLPLAYMPRSNEMDLILGLNRNTNPWK